MRLGSLFIEQANLQNHQYKAQVFFNTTAKESSIYFANVLSSAILRKATGNPNARISAKVEPMPRSEQMETTQISFEVIFYLVIAIVFIPGMISSFMVYERETEIKH